MIRRGSARPELDTHLRRLVYNVNMIFIIYRGED